MSVFNSQSSRCQTLNRTTLAGCNLIKVTVMHHNNIWTEMWFSMKQTMEGSGMNWDALFEPYQFFEAYKNYLQIDISAANDDDLRNWKGWVESRLRQLTLKVVICSSTLSYVV